MKLAYIKLIVFVTFISVAVIFTASVFLQPKFSDKLSAFAHNLGLYHLGRVLKITTPTYSGFFKALDSQHLSYDFNRDGMVTGSDYKHLSQWLTKDTEFAEESALTMSTSGDEIETQAQIAGFPSIKSVATDTFTGSATVTHLIESPNGEGGINPGVGVAYSSGTVDDLLAGVDTADRNSSDHSYQKQAGILGLGWGLSGLGSIIRDTKGTLNDLRDDTFILSYAGGYADLVLESGDVVYSVYRTVPNLKIKVERFGICKNYDYGFGTWNICRFTWRVHSGDGSIYIFGTDTPVANWQRSNDPDAKYFPQGSGNEWYPLYDDADGFRGYNRWLVFGSDLKGYHALTTEWPLTKVISKYSSVIMTYKYQFEFGNYESNTYVKASYPLSIVYSKHELVFAYEDRLDKKTHEQTSSDPKQALVANKRLKQVSILTKNRDNITVTQRVYRFGYSYGYRNNDFPDTNNNGLLDSGEVISGRAIHSLLKTITIFNNDPDKDPNTKHLPAYEFGYGEACAGFVGGCPLTAYVDKTDTQARTPNDFFLRNAHNGLKGRTTFEYWSNNSGGNALPVQYCNKEGICKTDREFNTQRHRVSTKTNQDGMGNSYREEFIYPTNVALAYVDGNGDVKTEFAGTNCCTSCGSPREGAPYCSCPGDNFYCTDETATNACTDQFNCEWDKVDKAPCCNHPIIYQYKCATGLYGETRETCIGQYNTYCMSDCYEREYVDVFSGYEFLGYGSVEVKTYDKNSNSTLAAHVKSNYFRALQSSGCFKPSPLKGMISQTTSYEARLGVAKYQTTLSKYTVRFGNMFSESYVEKEAGELASICTSYDHKKTVSLVLPTETITKLEIPNGSPLCTKTATNYTPISGGIDHFALGHKQINYGKVHCADFRDDVSDSARYSYFSYTEPDIGLWLHPLLKESYISDSSGYIKHNHVKTFYDDKPFGSRGIFGNITKEESYLNGSLQSTISTVWNTNYPWQINYTTDALGSRTTYEYDAFYRNHQIKISNALGHSSDIEYDFNTADTKHPNYGGVKALPVKTVNINGVVSYMVYDDWGRPYNAYAPGSHYSDRLPSGFTRVYYFNELDLGEANCTEQNFCKKGLGLANKPKFAKVSGTRLDDEGSFGRVSVTSLFYDGFGAEVQKRISWYEKETTNAGIEVDGEGLRDLVSSVAYNSLGTTQAATNIYTSSPQPYDQIAYDTHDFMADTTIQKTLKYYDGFGRMSSALYADGSIDRWIHDADGDPLKKKVLNPNCNDAREETLCAETIHLQDAFG
jgi:hypothetical protein